MLLRRLLDPEETARRRKLRARIVRRNRIKREIEQGLEPKWRRIPRPVDRTANDYGWDPLQDGTAVAAAQNRIGKDGNALAFLLTAATPASPFDATAKRAKPAAVMDGVDQVASRFAARQAEGDAPTQLPAASAIDGKPSMMASAPGYGGALLPGTRQRPTASKRPTNDRVRARWRDVMELLLIQRHEEILAKNPKRVWRQERLGLLLFSRKRYKEAIDHLVAAITLGCTSSICWRRLAQSHWCNYASSQDWDALWDSKAAFEQALVHLDMACNPYVLFEYAQVLEALGSYDSALNACASLMSTFPKFAKGSQVKLRFVLLQRYQLLAYSAEMEAGDKERTLAKCIEITKSLLLEQNTESVQVLVLYMHIRMNELMYEVTSKRGDGPGTVARAAKTSADQTIDQLYKLALATKLVALVPGRTWRSWWLQTDTFAQWADHFQQQHENIVAADALARAMELMEAVSQPIAGPIATRQQSAAAPMTLERKISLYLAMAENYYNGNQMEKAIRTMETIFQLNPYLQTVRQSLAAWFPAKWRHRIELEDASQVQIARVLRGLWGRVLAHRRRHDVERSVEAVYRANPYHPLHRRNVARLLKAKYAPLFAAQDLAARTIQKAVKKYLSYARIRWALAERKNKEVQSLRAKHATKKYRYNRAVRFQLAQALPDEFEARFRREDKASTTLQRWIRGERVRRAYRAMVTEKYAQIEREKTAATRIQRAYLRYRDRSKALAQVSAQRLLFEAQRRIQLARQHLARLLQRLYYAWRNRLLLLARQQVQAVQRKRKEVVRRQSAGKIQRNWRRYEAKKRGDASASEATMLLEQLKRGHERLMAEENAASKAAMDREASARKIQSLYRGKRIRASLGNITRKLAPPAPIELVQLMQECEASRASGKCKGTVVNHLETVSAKRSLFDFPIVILKPEPHPSLPMPHLLSVIQHSSLLHTLILDGGDYRSPRIELLFQALQASKTIRVLGLGMVITSARTGAPNPLGLPSTPEDESEDEELNSRSTFVLDSASRERLSPIQVLCSTLRNKNFLLEQLHFHGNDLLVGSKNGAGLAAIVGDYFYGRYGKLKRLSAQEMHLSDDSAARLGDALSINTVLEHLNLSGNVIHDNAATAIATAGLRSNHSLVYLNLADNSIGSKGAKALFSALEIINRTLKTLILSNNAVMNDAVASVFAALQTNAVLELVDLRGNLIHQDHLDQLASAMKERAGTGNEDLRLFLARRRFSGNADRSRALSPVLRTAKKSKQPLSPHKWIKANPTNGADPLIQRPTLALPRELLIGAGSPVMKRQKPAHRAEVVVSKQRSMRLPTLSSC